MRSQGPLPAVTDHCPRNWPVDGLNSPIMLLLGGVNQMLPEPSNARKIGWLPVMLGSVKNANVCVEALSSPIWPGAAPEEQAGAKSDPGSAHQTLPALSVA